MTFSSYRNHHFNFGHGEAVTIMPMVMNVMIVSSYYLLDRHRQRYILKAFGCAYEKGEPSLRRSIVGSMLVLASSMATMDGDIIIVDC